MISRPYNTRRMQKSGDMSGSDLREMSLMHIFRDSVARRDARDGVARYTDGVRDLTLISQKRREGASEESLRINLALDIAVLMNTIRLDVCVDLTDHPRVSRSVVNHGFEDMDTLWRRNRSPGALAAAVREALIQSEPRLRPETVEVRVLDSDPTVDQCLSLEIVAEMICDPFDIPMQFVADLDPGAGKIAMRGVQGA